MKARPDAKSPRRTTTGEAGAQAETLAARFLEARGLKLVERNWRSRFGELDLVLREGDTIVIVEVRMRRSKAFGGAAASIDAKKKSRLLAAAREYLARGPDRPCRFDVVLITGDTGAVAGSKLAPEIEWIRDAITE